MGVYMLHINFIAVIQALQILIQHSQHIMRSLYVDDIPGAKPSNRYFDKALYSQRHRVEIQRFGPKEKNYKRVFQWYKPIERHVEPIQKRNFPLKVTAHLHQNQRLRNPEQLSTSLMDMRRSKQKVAQKITQLSPRLSKSTMLSETGKQTLDNDLASSLNNPYFPHMYVDSNFQKNKWTGERFWIENQTKSINFPKQSDTVAKAFGK